MSKNDYIKWFSVPGAHLSNIKSWAGGAPDDKRWIGINQYLASNLSDEDYQRYRVTTEYLEDSDGIELFLGEIGADKAKSTQWGGDLRGLAEHVVFKLTSDENELEAIPRNGGKIEELDDQPLGFTLKKWTLKYRTDIKFKGEIHRGGEAVMHWQNDSSNELGILSWQYLPY